MKDVQENHEFLADQEVIKHTSRSNYIQVLIENTVYGHFPIHAHSFSKPLIFKRLAMIKKDTKTHYLSIVLSSILFASSLFMVGCEWSTIEEEILSQEVADTETIFKIVEEQATPKAGITRFYDEISTYLNNALAGLELTAADEGVSYIQFTIEKDGSLSEIKCVKSINTKIDELAMEALRQAGEWNPGKQAGKIVRSVRVVPIRVKL